MSATLLELQESREDESFTATMHIGPTRHLPAHFQKGGTAEKEALCKALADVPSLAAAKSAAHLISCGAHDDSRDIKFSSMGPEDKSRRVAGNVPDGNPSDVLLSIPQAISIAGGGVKGTTLTRVCSSNTFTP
jgi:hypothetical protein